MLPTVCLQVYGSIVGIKVLNLATRRVCRVIGSPEPDRFLACALYQGTPPVDSQYLSKAGASEKTSAELLLTDPKPDPTVFCTRCVYTPVLHYILPHTSAI